MSDYQLTSQPRFAWSWGSWLGGQVGSSAWLLAGAIALKSKATTVALIWFVGCVLINTFGLWLWSKRSQLSAYAAVQLLLGAAGIVGVLAWAFLLKTRGDVSIAEGWPTNYWPFVIVPVLMCWLAVVNRR